MGTRHLIAAYDKEGVLRLAQYGQFDGYPSCVGIQVLGFLRRYRSEQLGNYYLQECRFLSEREMKGVTIRCSPQFSRQTSADVLDMIYNAEGLDLYNSIDFAADGLFCEWAYVIDYRRNTFEVYKGMRKDGKCEGRFADMKPATEGYSPVSLIATFALNDLPTDEKFLALEEFDWKDEVAA